MNGEHTTGTGNAGSIPAHGEKLLRLPQVLEMTGRGRTATLDDVKVGTFPKPIKCGTASMWVYSEILAWIDQRIRQSRGQR